MGSRFHKSIWVFIIFILLLAIAVFPQVSKNATAQKKRLVNTTPENSSRQKPWERDWKNFQTSEDQYYTYENQVSSGNNNIDFNSYTPLASQSYASNSSQPSTTSYGHYVDTRLNNTEPVSVQRESMTYNNQEINTSYEVKPRSYDDEYTSSYSVNTQSVPPQQNIPAPPSHLTSCDGSGCWDNLGNRYRGSGDTYFPSGGGVCRDIGGQLQCH